MRVTAKTKEQTRQRILVAAHKLFSQNGYQQTTTRDITAAVGIAAGTLFNYFPTKEDLALAIVAQSLGGTTAKFRAQRRGDETLDELLFAHATVCLRSLRPYRGYAATILSNVYAQQAGSSPNGEADRIRTHHLETVKDLLASRKPADNPSLFRGGSEPSSLVMHLYWTLFMGVLAYWAGDESPHQEDTLALLDQSMKLLASSVSGQQGRNQR